MLAVLVELGLDRVVAVDPWLIVAFGLGLVAAVLGGWPGGLLAAATIVVAQAVLIPLWIPGVPDLGGLGPQVDVASGLTALVAGLWIRNLILHPRPRSAPAEGEVHVARPVPGIDRQARASGLASSDRPTDSPGRRAVAGGTGAAGGLNAASDGQGASPSDADPARNPVGTVADRAGIHALAAAIRDLEVARTPAQVADALARHAASLSGAAGSIVYLARDGSDGYTALGRHGAIDPSTPDSLPPGRSGAAARQHDPEVVERPIPARASRPSGSATAGVLQLVGAAPGSAGPAALVEVLVQVAADALERGRLEAGRRAAETEAASAVGRVGVLARLAAALVGATTVAEVARTLVDLAVDDLAAGFATLHVADPGSGAFDLAHARGYPAGLQAAERSIVATTAVPVTRAAADRTIVDVAGEDGWRAAFPAASNVPAITGVRAITAIPMQIGGVVHGVLTIGWRTAADRTRADRNLLATAADQGAQALERAVLHANDEDARRFQEAFVSVVSHELRTPITTILAGSRLLRRRLDGDARSADLSDDIEVEAERLTRIVDDLLVLSRLERRHLTIGDEPVHLDHLLDRVVSSESVRWPDHRIAVRPTAGSHVVLGDETYVEQVLRNLISNAAKYSPAGSLVEVAVDDAANDDVHVRVLDQGVGVAPAEVDDLFSLFYRSPSTAASAAGAGIGLFVSRRLVTEMGGRMWAQPRPGGGSEFGFSLACYPIDESELDGELDCAWLGPASGGD